MGDFLPQKTLCKKRFTPFGFIASVFPFMLFMLTLNPAFTIEVVIDLEKVTNGFL